MRISHVNLVSFVGSEGPEAGAALDRLLHHPGWGAAVATQLEGRDED